MGTQTLDLEYFLTRGRPARGVWKVSRSVAQQVRACGMNNGVLTSSVDQGDSESYC